jgi:lipopolysaccharide export system protein LptC
VNRNWRVLLTISLLLGALVSGWSVWRNHAALLAPADNGGRSDYVLHDYEIIALDKDGKEAFTLLGPILRETPGRKTMVMDTPLFLIPDTKGLHWTVQSKRGWVSDDREHIRLTGNVRAIGPRNQPQPAKITSQQLNVYPKTKLATAPGAVTITQPGSILRGHGLAVNLANKQYQLKSQVRARYVRSPH